jgi:serine protease Do
MKITDLVLRLFLVGMMLMSNCFITSAFAIPSDDLLKTLNAEVYRVEVAHQNGKHGLGSAVVIAKDQLVTNCHVVTNAKDVKVMVNGVAHEVTGLKPDWHHDICIITTAGLDLPVAEMGESKNLHYQTPVLTVGYPDKTTTPVNTFGEVDGLLPMDDGLVIRASSAFNLGASGGGMFDETGKLVGIITLKSRGANAQYFFMPVEWATALMHKPTQALGLLAEKPFWALADSEKPYFMKVVQPSAEHDWAQLKAVSTQWVSHEPNTAESWLNLAIAEYETKQYELALTHFKKVMSLRNDCVLVQDYINKLTERIANKAMPSSQLVASIH